MPADVRDPRAGPKINGKGVVAAQDADPVVRCRRHDDHGFTLVLLEARPVVLSRFFRIGLIVELVVDFLVRLFGVFSQFLFEFFPEFL